MEWEIQKSNTKCSGCEKQFEQGEEYHSALYDEGEQFSRKDFCGECWTNIRPEEAFSFWKTRVPTREEQRKLLVDDDVLLEFFLRLTAEQSQPADAEETAAQHKVNFRYILALVLMRKRILRFEDIIREDGKEYLVLRYPREKTDFKVLDPGLAEEEIETVKDDLSQILNVAV